jgi:hypothetical protein
MDTHLAVPRLNIPSWLLGLRLGHHVAVVQVVICLQLAGQLFDLPRQSPRTGRRAVRPATALLYRRVYRRAPPYRHPGRARVTNPCRRPMARAGWVSGRTEPYAYTLPAA